MHGFGGQIDEDARLNQVVATLAHQLVDLGLLCYPSSRALFDLRRQALDRLREVYQQLSPFKFMVYSAWAAAEGQGYKEASQQWKTGSTVHMGFLRKHGLIIKKSKIKRKIMIKKRIRRTIKIKSRIIANTTRQRILASCSFSYSCS